MKNEFRIFFAIPFDPFTRNAYESIQKKLTEHYRAKGYNLITIIGDKEVGPSKIYSDVMTFKAQNKDLHDQFFEGISRSHVVVADLSYGNPNVHLELGIALAKNKNILRVTGRRLEELGFDIRNLKASEYTTEEKLFEIIRDYLDTFFMVKGLKYDAGKDLYTKLESVNLPGTPGEIKRGHIWSTTKPIAEFRDGGIQLKAYMSHPTDDRSWIGVIFRRAGEDDNGYLLRFSKGGLVELILLPESYTLASDTCSGDELMKPFHLLVDIQNDEVEAKLNDKTFYFSSHLESI